MWGTKVVLSSSAFFKIIAFIYNPLPIPSICPNISINELGSGR